MNILEDFKDKYRLIEGFHSYYYKGSDFKRNQKYHLSYDSIFEVVDIIEEMGYCLKLMKSNHFDPFSKKQMYEAYFTALDFTPTPFNVTLSTHRLGAIEGAVREFIYHKEVLKDLPNAR